MNHVNKLPYQVQKSRSNFWKIQRDVSFWLMSLLLIWSATSCTKPSSRIQSRMPGEERTYNDIKADKYEGMVKDLDLTFTTNLKLLKNANESYIRYYKSYIKLGASSGYKGENIINNEKYLADQEKYIENLLKESFIKLGKKTEYEQEIIKAGGVKVKVTGVPVEMKDYSAILLFLQEVM